jgi:hypothetical protein
MMMLVALAMGSAFGAAQGGGAFTAGEFPKVPGLAVDRSGIVANSAAADKLSFSQPLEAWEAVSSNSFGKTVFTSKQDWNPSKIRYNALSPGVTAYFGKGIRFRVASTGSPYLSWTEGSVDTDVPTPDSRFLTISFHNDQPPIVLGFIDKPCHLQISGKPGDYQIESAPDYAGWVRIALPNGDVPYATNSAASLGKLSNAVAANGLLWTQPDPELVSRDIMSDPLSVSVTYKFSQPAVLIPSYLTLAPLSGYAVRINSKTTHLGMVTDRRPSDVTVDGSLSIRFPIRQVPVGRAVGLGTVSMEPIGTVSPFDLGGVVELALDCCVSARDRLTLKTANTTLNTYLEQTPFFTDVPSGQKFPFKSDGAGIDLVAAHSLLMQLSDPNRDADGAANSLFQSLCWRQDWTTGLLGASDPVVARRASAVAAVTGASCLNDGFRLVAAQLQAGLSGEAGLAIWQTRRRLIAASPKFIEPIFGVRQAVFGISGKHEPGFDFGTYLLSPYRVRGDDQPFLNADWILSWPVVENKPSVLTFDAPAPYAAVPLENIDRLTIENPNRMVYAPTTAGTCRVQLAMAGRAAVPPATTPVPRYSE